MGKIISPRALVPTTAEAILGYADLAGLPESTGVEKLVLKRGNLFAVTGRLGDIQPPGARDQGAYFEDTRFLSKWKLTMAGGPPVCLSTQSSSEYTSQIDLTVTTTEFGGLFADPVNFLHLRREQLIDDVFVERLTFTNFLIHQVDYWVEYEFASDFADQFEVRGARRRDRGTLFVPRVEKDSVVCCYQGRDGVLYRSEIRFSRAPDEIDHGRARFNFHLGANETSGIEVSVTPSFHLMSSAGRTAREQADERRRAGAPALTLAAEEPESGWIYPGGEREDRAPRSRRFDERISHARGDYAAFAKSAASLRCDDEVFNGAIRQATADLKALQIQWDGRRVISAGIPWYASPFGRDALITGFQSLLVTPEIARDALIFLAAHQGKREDAFREEEPGKILHEIRRGELARCGEVPHTPYYGSVDSTPLFLVLLTEYLQWTDDRQTGEQLLPAAEAALEWIERYGDKDGDGFVEYQRITERGLINQGWKDSRDGVPHADGTVANPPIALVEVQGYCIDARRRMARLYRQLGRRDEASRLMASASRLARKLDEAFWIPEKGHYALALDRDKRRVEVVTSNQGHLLFSRVVSEERARKVARSLLSPESFSGWGIRTLARGQRPYNPLSYHNGTVWPHDNSMIAMGFSHYGMQKQAVQVLSALYETARHLRHQRLPELFCGMGSTGQALPVQYPVSCSPQAWASGSFFLLLRACLGLYPNAPQRSLKIVNPHLPTWMSELHLQRLAIGQSRVSVRFTRTREGCFAAITETEGPPISVRIEVGAHADEP